MYQRAEKPQSTPSPKPNIRAPSNALLIPFLASPGPRLDLAHPSRGSRRRGKHRLPPRLSRSFRPGQPVRSAASSVCGHPTRPALSQRHTCPDLRSTQPPGNGRRFVPTRAPTESSCAVESPPRASSCCIRQCLRRSHAFAEQTELVRLGARIRRRERRQ